MKVELKKETDESGNVRFWIYLDDRAKDCFTDEKDARKRFGAICGEKKIEILQTKEI